MKTIAVIALLAFTALPVRAEGGSIVLANEVWAPYRIGVNEDPASWSGIDVDIARELERRMGITIKIVNAPWARCLETVKLGQCDIMTGVAWTDERSRAMDFVPTSYSAVKPVFYARAGKAAILSSYEDLRAKKIGQSTNSAYFDRYNKDQSLDKISLKDEETILRMLALGRIDLAIGTEPNISWDIARFDLKNAFEPTVWQPGERTPLYVVVSRKSAVANLTARIDACLRQMLDEGAIDAILERYK